MKTFILALGQFSIRKTFQTFFNYQYTIILILREIYFATVLDIVELAISIEQVDYFL
jgi:hypothetical protein